MTSVIDISAITVNGNVRVGASASPALVASVQEKGIITAITVRPGKETGEYVLVAGARRLDAAKQAGKTEVPAHVVGIGGDLSQAQIISMQVAENLHRKELTAYELAQAAWDLKLEGLKQDEVATSLSVGKKDISALQKIGKALNADDDLDVERTNKLSFAALTEIADEKELKPSDLVRVVVDENKRVHSAVWQVETELATVEFYEQMSDQLQEWSAAGIQTTSQSPQYAWGKMDTYGSRKADPKVARLEPGVKQGDTLDIPIEDHIGLECHMIYLSEGQGRVPQVQHWCMSKAQHLLVDGDVPVANVKQLAKTKATASADAKRARSEKDNRRQQAAAWIDKRRKETDVKEYALSLVVSNLFREDHIRMSTLVLGLNGEREKGADYDWYSKRLIKWYKDNDMTDDQIRRFKLNAIIAHAYIENGFGQVTDELAAIEVKDSE